MSARRGKLLLDFRLGGIRPCPRIEEVAQNEKRQGRALPYST